MNRNQKPDPKLLAEINKGINEANTRAAGEFNGLHGSLPEGTSIVLADILAYVRAAYNRAQRLDERRKMMQAWADYLDGLRAGAGVVPADAKGMVP
jgi:hypothetical protein